MNQRENQREEYRLWLEANETNAVQELNAMQGANNRRNQLSLDRSLDRSVDRSSGGSRSDTAFYKKAISSFDQTFSGNKAEDINAFEYDFKFYFGVNHVLSKDRVKLLL